MGAWDSGNFDNDSAVDFIYTLDNDLTPVQNVVATILNTQQQHNGYIDADDASEALAAGEVVALLKGKPAPEVPDGLLQWHQQHGHIVVDDQLLDETIHAVKYVLQDSELRELWEEGGDTLLEEWSGHVRDLIQRLESSRG